MSPETAGWLDRARDSIKAAQTLHEADLPAEAISRAYYAMFYCAKAMTVEEGKDLAKHSAIIAAFGHDFVASGQLSSDLHKYLRQAFDERNRADYSLSAHPTAADAAEQITHACDFLAAVEGFLEVGEG